MRRRVASHSSKHYLVQLSLVFCFALACFMVALALKYLNNMAYKLFIYYIGFKTLSHAAIGRTYYDCRFRCKDNNVAFTNVQPHNYRVRQVEPCRHVGWSSQALILSILALGAIPKQQQQQIHQLCASCRISKHAYYRSLSARTLTTYAHCIAVRIRTYTRGQSDYHVPPVPISAPERWPRLGGQMRLLVTKPHDTLQYAFHSHFEGLKRHFKGLTHSKLRGFPLVLHLPIYMAEKSGRVSLSDNHSNI